MKTKKALSIILLVTLCIPMLPALAEDVNIRGPWADELFFKIYLSPEPEYLGLGATG